MSQQFGRNLSIDTKRDNVQDGKGNSSQIRASETSQNVVQRRMKFIKSSVSSVNDKRRHLDRNIQISETQMTSKDLRSVSMFWFEKVLILLNTAQLYCLEWILSQYWSWPYNWLAYTRFLCGFNLDFFSMSDRGAGMARSNGPYSVFGEMRYYHRLAILYACLPFMIAAFYCLVERILIPNAKNWRFVMKLRSSLYTTLIFLLLVMHCPITLAVLRFTVYNSDNEVTAQPAVKAGSLLYVGVTLITLGLWLIYSLFLLGYCFGVQVYKQVLYNHTLDHERAVQQQELEYMLHLSDDWLVSGTACMASFTRHGLYAHLLNTVEKTLLVVVYCYFRFSKGLQAILFWMVYTFFTVHQLGRRNGGPYRCMSSNVINIICRVTLFMDYTLGMMTGYGVKSSMLVASNQSFWLFSINGMGTLLTGSYLVFVFFKGDTWPTDRTIQVIFKTIPEAGRWLDLVRSTRGMLLDFATYPRELVPMNLIEAHMRALRECWLVAKSRESILEGILRECLDECALAHQEYRPSSLLPAHTLEMDLEAAKPLLVERRKAQALMHPKKRALLTKILALRAFMGSREVEREEPVAPRPKSIQYASRDLEEEPEAIRLLVEQSAALSTRVQASAKGKLEEQGQIELETTIREMTQQWRTIIRTWESEFQQRYGKKPSTKERETKRLYYKHYRNFRNLLDQITHADLAKKSKQHGDGLSLLTEKVLSHASHHEKQSLDDILKISKNWKKVIKKWEKDFEQEHERKPTQEEKKQRRGSWYQNYKEIKDLQMKLGEHIPNEKDEDEHY
mmetsp:Transcript_12636/g.16595  ORF Transcript_12636/g.16595 Transcript_12636/m.16595 type:complete len:789 (+) Transcript_12636:370-2736(+)